MIRGQCLRGDTQPSYYIYRQRIGGIDRSVRTPTAPTADPLLLLHPLRGDGVEVFHERQAADTKEGVEYVGHISRPVRYAATLCVLTAQDEFRELVAVDPTSLQEINILYLSIHSFIKL